MLISARKLNRTHAIIKFRMKKKNVYRSPKMEVYKIQLEQGIAVGSAKVNPRNSDGNIYEEWDVEEETRNIDF